MKTLLFNYPIGLSYPVGQDMRTAIHIAMKIAATFNTIEEYKDKRINVWCRGSSGMILGSLFVSNLMNNERVVLCHVKKLGEKSHGEGTNCHTQSIYYNTLSEGPFINVVIDDFISSGETIEQIQHLMINESNRNMDVVCLSDCSNHTEQEFKTFFKHIPEYYIHRENRQKWASEWASEFDRK